MTHDFKPRVCQIVHDKEKDTLSAALGPRLRKPSSGARLARFEPPPRGRPALRALRAALSSRRTGTRRREPATVQRLASPAAGPGCQLGTVLLEGHTLNRERHLSSPPLKGRRKGGGGAG
eukprot:767915-Hanusia_phi.AAC.1